MNNLLIVIVFSTILINVSGYKLQPSAIEDDGDSYDQQESSSTVIDSTSAEDDQQLTPEPDQSTSPPSPPPPPPPPTTTTTTTMIDDNNQANNNRIDYQDLFRAKLIGRSSNYDHKEDKYHRSVVMSTVDTYQLPSNDLLVRARTVANVDWIVRRSDLTPKSIDQQQQQQQSTQVSGESNNQPIKTFAINNRRKRQTDVMTTNQNQFNGGMDPYGQSRPDSNNNNPVVARFRQFVNRMKDMIADIRDAFTGNRINTNMNGPPTINNNPQ